MDTPIHILNETLISSLKDTDMPLGLADGKMGICIYFYILSRYEKNKEYENIAENILDEIFENIDVVNSIDVKNGLTGIGLGIDYLIKNNYVKGNINAILNDIDDVIFKNISYSKYIEKIDALSLIHILYYLCVRLKSQKTDSENEYLFRELVIQTVNNLYERIDLSFYEEPFVYTIDYPVSQLLFVLSEVCSLNFYNYRLEKIVEELSYKILSIIPLLHCNRLYLLWGMNYLNKEIKDERWEKHIQLISSHIDMDIIIEQELMDKNIFFKDGFVNIYLMISNLTYLLPDISYYKDKILWRIKESRMWNSLLSEYKYFDGHKGLYNGYCGTALFMRLVKNGKI